MSLNDFLNVTFKGLKPSYYFRHLFFAAVFAIFMIVVSWEVQTTSFMIWIVINALLYPYARLVYETVMGFLMGETVYYLPIIILFMWRFFIFLVVFMFSIFIAPIGLLILYFYHRKNINA